MMLDENVEQISDDLYEKKSFFLRFQKRVKLEKLSRDKKNC